MAWLPADEIKSRFRFRLADSRDDKPITFASESAANDLEDWLLPDDYAMAIYASEPSDAEQKKRYSRIVNAHAYLTASYVFFNNASDVLQERDDTNIVTYYKPDDLLKRSEQFKMQAKNLIAGFSVISFSEVIETETGVMTGFGSTLKWF